MKEIQVINVDRNNNRIDLNVVTLSKALSAKVLKILNG